MKHYALLGKHLGHSFSAKLFNDMFEKEKIDARYSLIELDDIAGLPALIAGSPELFGLNVTVPYKEAVIPYLGSLSEEAWEIGAVNVIDVKTMTGYNTDAPGFRKALEKTISEHDLWPYVRLHPTALVLGSGGAAKAVAYALERMQLKPVFVSRNPRNGQLSYSAITPDLLAGVSVIVNATPLGMFPDTESFPNLPYHLLHKNMICFDLVYNPQDTKFMKKCRENGAITTNGLDMLINQAMYAWEIWNHVNGH